MEYWQRYDNKRFNTEEDAYQDSLENEESDVLEDYLLKAVGLDVSALLHWAMGQDGFWEAFQDEITEAREIMFEDNYCHWEEPDDDDEDDWVDPIIRAKNREGLTHYGVDKWGNLYEVNPTE